MPNAKTAGSLARDNFDTALTRTAHMLPSKRTLELGRKSLYDAISSDEEDAATETRSTEEVEIVVAHLKRLARTANLEFALRVGALIIHHFYDGDTGTWRRRGPKTTSFRQLSRHPGLPFSAGALYRCVALYELCDRLSAPSRWQYLGASHLRAVLGLPSVMQEKLLATANSKRWTVKTLQEEALRQKTPRMRQGGRRAQPPIAKSLKSLKKCLDDHRSVLGRAEDVSPVDIELTLSLLEETKACIEQFSVSLRADASAAEDSLESVQAQSRARP
jgi:hypothetical protein